MKKSISRDTSLATLALSFLLAVPASAQYTPPPSVPAGAACLLVGCTMTGVILEIDGTDTAPSYSFTNDTEMGMFLTAGSLQLQTGDFSGAATSESAIGLHPVVAAFSHKDSTGDDWSLDLLDTIFNIRLDGTTRVTMDATEITSTIPMREADGTIDLPSYSFSSNPSGGMFATATPHIVVKGVDGSGVDAAGGRLEFHGGRGTGTAKGGNTSIFVSPNGASSGSTLNAGVVALFIDGRGDFSLGGIDILTNRTSFISGNDIATSVTDGAAGSLNIRGGFGTGAGTPGSMLFQTGTTLGSGSTQQTATTRLTIAETVATFTTTIQMGLNSDIIFEGSSADANDTTLTVINPTSTRTISLPNSNGAVLLSSLTTNVEQGANSIWGASNQLVFEGATANTEETFLTVENPEQDNTVTIQDGTGFLPVFQTGTSTLTDATATDIILFSIAQEDFVGGTLTLTTICADATEQVQRRSRNEFSCFNDAGTEGCTFSTGDSAEFGTGGANLSTHTLDITSATDTITFRLNSDCSLTPVVFITFWHIEFEQGGYLVVTEQN